MRRLAEALAEIRRAPLPFVLLGFTYAAYFLTGLIAFFTEGGVSESEEWRIFIVGWPTVSLAGPAAALLVAGLKRARYAEVESFYPLLLAANALCWVGYFVFHFPPPRLYEYEIAERALYPLVWLVPLANLLAFFALDRGRHLIAGINTTGVYALLPIAALYVGLNFSGYQIDNPELLAKTWWPQLSGSQRLFAALALAFIALLSSHLKSPFPRAPHSVAVDATVLLATVLLVFDTTFAFEDHHYNFYLGPVNDILRGKTLLADINCQYGVGVIYALALFFKLLPVPLNYQGFSLLLNVLLILQYALAYLLMRRVLGSQSFAVAALLLIVAANYFSQTGPTLPSTGPLRFGVAYALLAVFAFRTHWRIARYALVGLASLWSFESFTYTLTAYACAELYLLLQAPHRLRRLPSLIGGPAVAVAVGHLFLALFTYLRAGAWPEWSHYFEYLALYSVDEFGTLTVEAWRPWALFIAVYFLSLLLLAYRVLLSRPADAESSAFIAGLTGFGIVQFTYFLGRSHHNNLYHICIPLVFIATYWLLLMRRADRVPKTFALGDLLLFCCRLRIVGRNRTRLNRQMAAFTVERRTGRADTLVRAALPTRSKRRANPDRALRGRPRAHCPFPAPRTHDRNADAEPKEPHFPHK